MYNLIYFIGCKVIKLAPSNKAENVSDLFTWENRKIVCYQDVWRYFHYDNFNLN